MKKMNKIKLLQKLIWMEGSINSLLFVANDQGLHDALDCIYERLLDIIKELNFEETNVAEAAEF